MAAPPALPPSPGASQRRPCQALPAPGAGRWAVASGQTAEEVPPAPPFLRPRSQAGGGCRGARVPGPASQAMGEGGAVGRRRPFPGAPRRRWWRRQQQQQRQRQRWWPGRSEGAGRAAMGLAGLQVGVSGPAARGAGGARDPARPGGRSAMLCGARPGPAGRPLPPVVRAAHRRRALGTWLRREAPPRLPGPGGPAPRPAAP